MTAQVFPVGKERYVLRLSSPNGDGVTTVSAGTTEKQAARVARTMGYTPYRGGYPPQEWMEAHGLTEEDMARKYK